MMTICNSQFNKKMILLKWKWRQVSKKNFILLLQKAELQIFPSNGYSYVHCLHNIDVCMCLCLFAQNDIFIIKFEYNILVLFLNLVVSHQLLHVKADSNSVTVLHLNSCTSNLTRSFVL